MGPSLASAKREKSLSIRLARSARLAGQRRTKRATVLQQLASANLQRNYLRPARAPRFVLAAPSPLANAQQKHVGLAKASTQHETTLAIVSPSWASVTKEKSPCTRLGKSARLAGPRRTRHACASQHSAFATRRGAILWFDHAKLPFCWRPRQHFQANASHHRFRDLRMMSSHCQCLWRGREVTFVRAISYAH